MSFTLIFTPSSANVLFSWALALTAWVISTAADTQKSGWSAFERMTVLAIALRIVESGMSSADRATGAAAAAGCATDGAPAPATAASTSALTMRPPGPDPITLARSIPCSAAIFLATGDALMRPPLAGDAVTAATGAGAAATTAAGTGVSAAGAKSADEPVSGITSSASAMMAMTCPTGTVTPSAMSTLRRTPEPNASISTTALSVSTSARMSPRLTLSPSLFNQRAIAPSVISAPIKGIRTSVTAT